MALAFLFLLAGVPLPAAPARTIIVEAPRLQSEFTNERRAPDRALARMRGGLRLPNGLNVAIGIDIQTWVDGSLALHTIYSSEGANAGVRVYTDGTDAPTTAPGTVTVSMPAANGGAVVVDRSPTGTTITAPTWTVPVNLNLVQGAPSIWLDAEGQKQVPVTPNGPAVQSDSGKIKLTTDDRGATVTLDAPMLEVQHLVGQATGIVVANTANDRAIDTVSSLNVDLQGVSPALMSGMFIANRIAADAVSRR